MVFAMSSASEQDRSSCSGSPVSLEVESPRSSPLHQLPQLTTNFTSLSCDDEIMNSITIHSVVGNQPFLRIVEQPQNYFRFRYASEMIGTHGSILGKSSSNSKKKTHPTVELVNYSGQALIRCQLAQHNKDEEHPHKLLEDDQDIDVSYMVPEHGSYKVGFPDMGIIHTAKKDVANLLFNKMSAQPNNACVTEKSRKELYSQCENLAKTINLNIVRLKFSAHDVVTGREICEPAFSDPIHNMKSAATNDLKICRISACCGKPTGYEDVFIFVEKVNKKNIKIRFFELDENGQRVWSAYGSFVQSDVHHQYGIVFRTPPYRNPKTPVNVKVFVELERPSDGRTSEPKEFTYIAEQAYRIQGSKKRKNTSSNSSLESISGVSSTNNLPTTLFNNNPNESNNVTEIPSCHIQFPVPVATTSNACDLGSALGTSLSQQTSPLWPGAPSMAGPAAPCALPQLQLDSAELSTMARDISMEGPPNFNQEDLAEYLNNFSSGLDISELNGMDFVRATLVTDSGHIKTEPRSPRNSARPNSPRSHTPKEEVKKEEEVSEEEENNDNQENLSGEENSIEDNISESSEYSAFYTVTEAVEVKQLVRELCEIIRDKRRAAKEEDVVRAKLERLMQIRLSNGDTFLHMALLSNVSSIETIVQIINSVNMCHLMDTGNARGETVLHLAAARGQSALVRRLLEQGCSGAARTAAGDTCLHYCVRRGRAATLRELAERGGAAVLEARDAHGRTALELCARDAREQAARVLAPLVPRAQLSAALHVLASRQPPHPADSRLARLFLEHGACPPPAAEVRADLAPLLDRHRALAQHEGLHTLHTDGDSETDVVKSEPEDIKFGPQDDIDVYESMDYTDRESSAGLCGLSEFGREVSRRVDSAGRWRELARRLDADALLSYFESQPSPAYALLSHVKEIREDITSKSLVLIFEDMGLPDVANIVKKFIESSQ